MLRRLLILFVLLFTVLPAVSSQTISKDIISAFEKGDSKKLSEHLNHNLELNILGKQQMVSRNQATRLLKEFFENHPPKSFKVTYEGTKQGSKYGIGELKTIDSKFRVNLYFISQDKEILIYNLIIEIV